MEGLPTPRVCYLTGTMNSLLEELTSMESRCSPGEGLPELVGEMRELKRFLDKLSGQQENHMQVTVGRKQARDLVFDIEDWMDLKPGTLNMVDPSDKEEINYFKTELEEARERFERYSLLDQVPAQLDLAVEKSTSVDPLFSEEKTCYLLLNDSRDTLEKHLMDKQMRLKVVSVVGREGFGKTTLAKEIFSKLQSRGLFHCQAFVSVGRRPDMTEILNDIFRQVIPPRLQIQPSIPMLREYLSQKRYFILLDGIWSMRAWKVINSALPANNLGSRVLATTCIPDIGTFCTGHPNDVLYQMTTLSEENSRILFHSRISPLVKANQANFEKDLSNMLNICGGIPLAIIVAAGLFSREFEEIGGSKMLQNCFISSPKQYSTPEGMKKILEISYAHLSLPLRSCFLYLSIFPEDHTIKKDRLIRLWEAEGFIPRRDKECMWVTGERYFNELVSRRLIQPVFDYDDDQAVGCTVHCEILDFIRSLSREENFATRGADLISGPFPYDTIRRFSLDGSNEDEAGSLSRKTVHLSRMRSLTVFGDAKGMFDHPLVLDYDEDEQRNFRLVHTVAVTLLSFKHMRVLDLEETKNCEPHLEGIEGLVLLRYLGLRGTGIGTLPIGLSKLEQLETLDLRENGHILSIGRFPKLVRLLGDIDATGVSTILEMPALEEVSTVRASGRNSLHMVAELVSKSKRLKMLSVSLDDFNFYPISHLLEEVVMSDIHSLSVNFPDCGDVGVRSLVEGMMKATAVAAVKFRPLRFELILSDSIITLRDNMASLVSLTHLRITCFYMSNVYDLGILGSLPNLVHLDLTSEAQFHHFSSDGIIVKGGFPCLKVLLFTFSHGPKWLLFEEGATPQLRRLRLTFLLLISEEHIAMEFGFQHLSSLTRVDAIIDCKEAPDWMVETLVSRIRDRVSQNPNKPTLELSLNNEDQMRMDITRHSKR